MTTGVSLEMEELMTGSLKNVFSTMLSIDLEPSTEPSQPSISTEETVASAVGFAGPSQGAVCLRMSQEFARISASAMLGLAVEELGEAEVSDVIGELTNMVAGDLKSKLGEAGAAWQLTVPTVVCGRGLHIATLDRKEGCHYEHIYRSGPHFVGLLVALKAKPDV